MGGFISLLKLLMISDFIAILLFFSIFSILYSTTKEGWDQAFWLNVGTSVFSTLLFILSVDKLLKIKQNQERLRMQKFGVRLLKGTMENHVRILANMYKASIKNKPDTQKQDLQSFFDKQFAEEIVFLNLMAKAPTYPNMTWKEHLDKECESLVSTIQNTCQKYVDFFDRDLFEALENLSRSDLILFLKWSDLAPKFAQEVLGEVMTEFPFGIDLPMYQHTELLVDICKKFNDILPPNESVNIPHDLWSEYMAPAVGESRCVNYGKQ